VRVLPFSPRWGPCRATKEALGHIGGSPGRVLDRYELFGMVGAMSSDESLARRFVADECGAELVEWALLTVLVVGGSLAAMVALRDEIGALFGRLIGQYLH